MVLRIVTDGMKMDPRGYYKFGGGHDHSYMYPGFAGTPLNNWIDCKLVNVPCSSARS